MKKVQCVPVVGQTELDLVDLGAYRIWQAGEIKDLPDELAATALTNPNFVEVTTTSVAAPTVGTTSSFSAPSADEQPTS